MAPPAEKPDSIADEQLRSDAELFGIEPFRLYRKSHPVTRKIIGLKPTATEEAIKNKSLPPPVPLTEYGKAVGWYGFTLIQLIKDRLAKAEARAAAPPHRELARRKKSKRGRS